MHSNLELQFFSPQLKRSAKMGILSVTLDEIEAYIVAQTTLSPHTGLEVRRAIFRHPSPCTDDFLKAYLEFERAIADNVSEPELGERRTAALRELRALDRTYDVQPVRALPRMKYSPNTSDDLTFADLEYRSANDCPEARRWRRNTAIVGSILGAAFLLIPLSLYLLS